MDDNVFRQVRCTFAERVEVDGGYRYDRVSLHSPDGDGALRTTMPPVVGDLIYLYDQSEQGPRGMFEVVARQWHYPSFGSVNWPHVGGIREGPSLDVVVVRATGVYRDEVETPDDE